MGTSTSLLQGIGLLVTLNLFGSINPMDVAQAGAAQKLLQIYSSAAYPAVDPLLVSVCSVHTKPTCSAAELSKHIQRTIEKNEIPIDGIAITDSQFFVPLISAAQSLDPALMEWLLERGASRMVSNTFFASPLHALFSIPHSLERQDERLDKIIAFYKTSLPYTQEAIIIEQLSGNNPLFSAAQKDNELLARRCLEYGLNPNAKDEQGRTVLMVAIERFAYKVIRVLQEYGVDITITDKAARTATDYAKRGFDVQLKKQLSTFPTFKRTDAPLHYKPASVEEEKAVQEVLEFNAQKLQNPPVPPKLTPVQTKTRPQRAKKPKKREEKEEDDEVFRDIEKAAPFIEEVSITGFNRPNLLPPTKKHKTRKKT